jgi:hypothetical protein
MEPYKTFLYPKTYIWVDVAYIAETQKAILIAFDGRIAWLPKAWICRVKRGNHDRVIARRPKADEAISIKISDGNWAKKFG